VIYTTGLWLALDLEGTCWEPGTPERALQSRHTEVIEIGAVALLPFGDTPLARFSTTVRPTLHPTLTDFCVRLTGLTQARLEGAPTLPEALSALWAWCEPLRALCPTPEAPITLITWGGTDAALLRRQAQELGLELPRWGVIDAQRAFERWRRRHGRPGAGFSLARALKSLEISREGSAHEALSDALAAWRVLERCLDPRALTPQASRLLRALAARAPKAPHTSWRRELVGELGLKAAFERYSRELAEAGLASIDPQGRGVQLTPQGARVALELDLGQDPQLAGGEASVSDEGGAVPRAALHLPRDPRQEPEGDPPAAHLAPGEGEASAR
jgi:inhibitor of KinA sporulation pathway (predicted exonuclease)